jgi:CBS domain-containing protein
MVLARDVMSKNLVYVSAEDPVTNARSLLRKHGFRVLPVLDDGRIVGVISRADVLKVTSSKANIRVSGLMDRNVYSVSPEEELKKAAKKLVSSGKKQLLVIGEKLVGVLSSLDIVTEFVRKCYSPLKKDVSSVMSHDVVYCSPEDSVASVWDKIAATGFSGMPVVSDKKVVGIVTRMDLLKRGNARISRESGRPRSIPVKKVMSTPPIVVSQGSSVAEAAEIMASRRILRLPVTGVDGALAGILDVEDVLGAYIRR